MNRAVLENEVGIGGAERRCKQKCRDQEQNTNTAHIMAAFRRLGISHLHAHVIFESDMKFDPVAVGNEP